ncbi:hypothetical protein C0Q70_18914 [Pomacea canaliculata]|uniref:Uncharacterized protein n=1 Tax=Pomacea canaliculata TaxID=400727 RepID=A0A2T7NHV0_POMCA|nr:hypothetical protein C0Q70_18914 [Pomacea canaliculata]
MLVRLPVHNEKEKNQEAEISRLPNKRNLLGFITKNQKGINEENPLHCYTFPPHTPSIIHQPLEAVRGQQDPGGLSGRAALVSRTPVLKYPSSYPTPQHPSSSKYLPLKGQPESGLQLKLKTVDKLIAW